MEKYFTKEQLKRLAVAEQNFYTAVKENYKRGTMQTINNLVADEYEKTTGEKLNRNWNCGACCLNNFKTVGRLYFESKEYWKEQEKNIVQTETEPALKTKELEKTVAKNNKPKGGRPKGSKNKAK